MPEASERQLGWRTLAGYGALALPLAALNLPLYVYLPTFYSAGLGLDLAEAVHAAHIVNAVHQATSLGFFTKAVPTMESRVTSLASRSSLQPSVPAGRMGTTR